jgi:hypothetical protein
MKFIEGREAYLGVEGAQPHNRRQSSDRVVERVAIDANRFALRERSSRVDDCPTRSRAEVPDQRDAKWTERGRLHKAS